MLVPQPKNRTRPAFAFVAEVEFRFTPVTPVRVGRGGFVRRLRPLVLPFGPILSLFFTLHCTRPPESMARRNVASASLGWDAKGYVEEGESSWYGGNGDGFAGKPTANGETFNPSELTCAHRTLPLGTRLEVENLVNGRTVLVRVNDRGPYAKGRILDLSMRAAKDLGFETLGVARVRIRSVDAEGRPAPLDPDADLKDPYTIQVAALTLPENIQRLSAELAPFGPVSTREAFSRDGAIVQRIRVGSFTRSKDAQRVLEEITQAFAKDRGVEPFITRQR